MRQSMREKLAAAKRQTVQTVEMDLQGLLKLMADGSREPEERRLNPTQERFIYESDRIAAYMGPAGCAKTSTICSLGMARSLLEPGSKGFVGRHDYNDLMDTTKLRLEEMLSYLPKGTLLDRDKSPPEKWWIRPIGDGEPSQITFMGMKDAIGSYEFNWAIVDEADEVEEKRVHELNSRLRFRRRGVPEELNTYAMRLCFNPPDTTHWLFTACTGFNYENRKVAEPWMRLYIPQPAENQRNLPSDYYEELRKRFPEDMLTRLVDGQWGSAFPGEPVYRQFKKKMHVGDELYEHGVQLLRAGSTLLRFWDFGYRRPCCIWAVVDGYGRLLVLASILGQNEEATAFIKRVKAHQAELFRAHVAPGTDLPVRDYGDPAAAQKKDTGSTLEVLSREGITLYYQRSEIEPGLRLIRKTLETLVEGEPALQLDRRRNTVLIAALAGGYRMDDKGLKPVKDGYYDHLADALRYGCINVLGSSGKARTQLDVQRLPDNVSYQENQDAGFHRTASGLYLPTSVAANEE